VLTQIVNNVAEYVHPLKLKKCFCFKAMVCAFGKGLSLFWLGFIAKLFSDL
jgi:hypothetical protein